MNWVLKDLDFDSRYGLSIDQIYERMPEMQKAILELERTLLWYQDKLDYFEENAQSNICEEPDCADCFYTETSGEEVRECRAYRIEQLKVRSDKLQDIVDNFDEEKYGADAFHRADKAAFQAAMDHCNAWDEREYLEDEDAYKADHAADLLTYTRDFET